MVRFLNPRDPLYHMGLTYAPRGRKLIQNFNYPLGFTGGAEASYRNQNRSLRDGGELDAPRRRRTRWDGWERHRRTAKGPHYACLAQRRSDMTSPVTTMRRVRPRGQHCAVLHCDHSVPAR